MQEEGRARLGPRESPRTSTFSERMGCSHVPRSYLPEGGLAWHWRGPLVPASRPRHGCCPCSPGARPRGWGRVQAPLFLNPKRLSTPTFPLPAAGRPGVPTCSQQPKRCRRRHQPLVRGKPWGLCVPGNEVPAASRTWGHAERARWGTCPVLTFTCDARLNGQGRERAGDHPWEGHVGAVGTHGRSGNP